MKTSRTKYLALTAAFAALLPLTGCAVDVQERRDGEKAEVDIRTPLGALSVRTDVESPETGLPVYPGARPLRDDDPENANVSMVTPFFGLKVVAAKFESDDDEDRILDFYKTEMKAYGVVTECRGEIDFEGRRGSREPVCKRTLRPRGVQLVAGTQDRHRLVAVKPRGSGSEIAVVYIQTRPQG